MDDSSTNMKKSYDDAVAYLYGLQKYGIKLGLDNPRKLLSLLGNPQESFKSIHVAGTNGKGSTSAMMASVLKSAGFRVGLFTSPHLVSFTERIRVDEEEITEQEVVELTNEIRDIVNRNQEEAGEGRRTSLSPHPPLAKGRQRGVMEFLPTFFEFVTAMGFLYFKRKGVEWAVVETGMGGRLDATNILVPKVSVITGIGYDHREFLGQTLKEISTEKAGIIKSGIPVVCSSQVPEAAGVLGEKAVERASPLFVFGRDFSAHAKHCTMKSITFDYEGTDRLDDVYVPLCGMHQIENASVALKSIELIMPKEGISYQTAREGLSRVQWPGRLELIKDVEEYDFDVLIDGAHNPSASKSLSDALKSYFIPFYGKIILILGIMADKDVERILSPLLPIAAETIFTAPGYERAASPERLAAIASEMGFASRVTHSMKEALEFADSAAKGGSPRALAVITGSFYTIGEARMCLGREGILARLRE